MHANSAAVLLAWTPNRSILDELTVKHFFLGVLDILEVSQLVMKTYGEFLYLCLNIFSVSVEREGIPKFR